MRKKNYKDHICKVCAKDFKSVRFYVQTCSLKCHRRINTKKFWKEKENPPIVLRRIMKKTGSES